MIIAKGTTKLRRLRSKALVAISLLTAALGTVRVQAAAVPTISVELGYRGIVRAGEWMPVDTRVGPSGYAGDATLEIQVEDSSDGYLQRQNFTSRPNPFGPTYRTAWDIPIRLSSGSSTQVRSYTLTDMPNPAVSVRLVQSGHLVAGPVVAKGHATRLLVGVLADRPSPFDTLSTLSLPNGLVAQIASLSSADVPDSPVLLRAFDLLVVDDFSTSSLSKGQQAALADYVDAGGSLVVGTGALSGQTLAGLPAALIPMEIQGTKTLGHAEALSGLTGLTVVTGTLQKGTAWLHEGAQPLVAELQVGAGRVQFATFSFTSTPIADWQGASALLRQIVIRSALQRAQSSAAPTGLMPGQGPIWGPLGLQGSITKRSWFLMPALGHEPDVSVPPLGLLGLLLAGYAVVLAGAYLLLRRKGRRLWFWIAAPAIAIVSAVAVFAASVSGPSAIVNQFSVSYVTQGQPKAYRETFTALRPSSGGDIRIAVSGSRLIAPFGVGYGPAANIGTGVRIDPQESTISLLRVTGLSVRGYATEEQVTAPKLIAQLSVINGRLRGQIQNTSDLRLNDAVILAAGSIIHIGDLAPGLAAHIDAPLITSNSANGGNLISLQIYPNSLSGGPASRSLPGDMRIALLQLILGEYDTPSLQIAPTLLAWLPGEAEPFTLDATKLKFQAQNAMVMPLTIGQVIGPLPTGFFAPRLVDASGNVELSRYGAVVVGGAITYEFSLPTAEATAVSGMSIHHVLPRGQYSPTGLVGPTGQRIAISEVWDWSHSAWVPITLANNGVTLLPDGTMQAQTGLVRLRIASVGNSSFRIGSVWLEGSVAPESSEPRG
jgi:hypothetical protein